jgi:hypothetical protein
MAPRTPAAPESAGIGETAVAYHEIKRRLYRDNRPGRVARWLNRAWAALHSWGIAPGWLVTLEVKGHKTGRPMSLPLVMASIGGERYLVSMLGADALWVRNAKAAGGHARLRHGRVEDVVLEEVDVAERAPILKEYLRRAPGARPHIPVSKDAPVEEFAKVAAEFPVFRVHPALD